MDAGYCLYVHIFMKNIKSLWVSSVAGYGSRINFSLCWRLEVGHFIQYYAHSLDGNTAAVLAEYALSESEHRLYYVFIVFVISMSVFNVYDFSDNFYWLVDIVRYYISSLSGQNLVSSINQILQEKQKTSLRVGC